MEKKNFWCGMLGIALAFGVLVVGCDDDDPSKNGLSKSYTEGDVYVAGAGVMLHYYFSNTLEGIEQAAFDYGITYLDPPLKNAPWILNPDLDINVKNAMASRGVSYSGTVYMENRTKYFSVNRKNDNSYFFTSYTFY
jgi:hypothetical protein